MGDQITSGAWAVLQATHGLQHGDPGASIEPGVVRAAALAQVDGTDTAMEFDGFGRPYAGMEALVWALVDAGLLVDDVSMAPLAASGRAAVEESQGDDHGLRVTDAGRAALASRS